AQAHASRRRLAGHEDSPQRDRRARRSSDDPQGRSLSYHPFIRIGYPAIKSRNGFPARMFADLSSEPHSDRPRILARLKHVLVRLTILMADDSSLTIGHDEPIAIDDKVIAEGGLALRVGRGTRLDLNLDARRRHLLDFRPSGFRLTLIRRRFSQRVQFANCKFSFSWLFLHVSLHALAPKGHQTYALP